MADKISIGGGQFGEDYEPSDSEDNYDEEEREILRNVRKGQERLEDDEREVMRFDSESDEDEDEAVDNSDFEEPENDGIPDSRAWGKRRSDYYNTDFVDQDYSTYNEKEEELARQEEEDAREIQSRLAKQLNDADFSLDVYSIDAEKEEPEKADTNRLKTDLSDLSVRQREQLFQKDSPEFAGLVSDFERNLMESDSLLTPVIKYASQQNVKHSAVDFAKTLNKIAIAYCTNISFYLLLKAKRLPIKNHPVVKRLVNLKQLLENLNTKYEKVVKPQLKILLEAFQAGVDVRPYLNKSITFNGAQGDGEYESAEENDGEAMEGDTLFGAEDEEQQGAGDARRGITYQIAKNKGLTPHRKKELRNPRVKHRGKFRKALIRRKGAVRTVRKELKRYGGEISGIKATVKKGIKIKS